MMKVTAVGLTVFFLFLISGIALPSSTNNEISIHPPPLSPGIFPCSSCHADIKTNYKKRELYFHTEIKIKGHAERERWCLDCHDAVDRDKLRLVSGEKIGFDKSYRLCGQCHGNVFKHWKAGVHGKRTGNWNGLKRYFLCTNCHNPHSPRFKPVTPEPPPLNPVKTLRR